MIFETIREYLNRDFETYISEWFPNARKAGNGLWRTGDFNDTKSKRGDGSLCFNTIEKYAKDFSTGETAGDIISIYAHRFCGGNQKRALDELIERYNLSYLIESFNDYNYKNNNYNNSNNSNNKKGNNYEKHKIDMEQLDLEHQEMLKSLITQMIIIHHLSQQQKQKKQTSLLQRILQRLTNIQWEDVMMVLIMETMILYILLLIVMILIKLNVI